jgi:acetylornithine deacetylase/succinyl-diaminopimelate desuccinylase-like protein
MTFPVAKMILMSVLAIAEAPPQDWPAVEKEATGMLEQFVKIDTSNPPGDVTAAVSFLERILKREGIYSLRYVADEPGGRVNLLARLPGSGTGVKPLLVLAHLDVVPADPSRWILPPFGAKVKDGELWGRGSLDMKGQGIIALTTMILLKRSGYQPERDLVLLFDSDEENGGEMGAKWMVKHHFADLDPEYVLDEGSAGSKGVYTDDGRTVFGVSVDEKKVLWLKVIATGDSGHGSMPGERNAVASLTKAMARLAKLNFPRRDTAVVAEMRKRLGRLADNPVTRALERTTVTITTLKAGVGDPPLVNVIPGTAEATVDCRLLPGDVPRLVLEDIRRCLDDPGLKIEVLHASAFFPPQRADSPLFREIEATVAAEVPGALTVPVLLPGATDSRYFRERGVPAYGFEPMVRSVAEGELIHGDNERIRLSEFNRGLRIYYRLLAGFLKVRA